MNMRNIFLVVLGVNVFVFMFFYYSPDEREDKVADLPAGTPKLVLLSEVDKASLTLDKSEPPSDAESKAPVKVVSVANKCFTIGPFKEENKITDFQGLIKKKVKKTGIRERVETLHWRYWVYLPAAASKSQAVKLASDLARKGLKDYYVIARGEFKNSISLGHFKEKEFAEYRLEAIKKMGYKPKMSAIEKEYTLYWLDYTAKNGNGFSSQALEDFELGESIRQFTRECGK